LREGLRRPATGVMGGSHGNRADLTDALRAVRATLGQRLGDLLAGQVESCVKLTELCVGRDARLGKRVIERCTLGYFGLVQLADRAVDASVEIDDSLVDALVQLRRYDASIWLRAVRVVASTVWVVIAYAAAICARAAAAAPCACASAPAIAARIAALCVAAA
jgi:hypothetical protein